MRNKLIAKPSDYHFEVWRSTKDQQWYSRLIYAGNAEPLLHSEGHKNSKDCVSMTERFAGLAGVETRVLNHDPNEISPPGGLAAKQTRRPARLSRKKGRRA